MATDETAAPPGGQVLIYRDGATRLQVRLDGRTAWRAVSCAQRQLFRIA